MCNKGDGADDAGVQDMEEEVSWSCAWPCRPGRCGYAQRLTRQYPFPIRYSRNSRLDMAILDLSMVSRPDLVSPDRLILATETVAKIIDPRMRTTQ